MTPESEYSIIERVLNHVGAGTTDLSSAEHQEPVAQYLTESQIELERRLLFGRHPLVIAPSATLASAGDFMTCDDLGPPILLTRAQDGVLHAFVNACRHRGTKLVMAGRGGDKSSFTCPYHAWTYGIDGRLQRISHDGGFCSLRPQEYGLVRLPAWERFGLIWARPNPQVGFEVDQALSELAQDLSWLRLEELTPYQPHEQTRRANWKLLVEGALESYHFRFVHPRTIYPRFFDNLLVADMLGASQRHILPRRSIGGLRGVERAPGQLRAHAHLVYFLFPNTFLLVQPDHVTLLQMQPLKPGQSRIVTTLLIPELPQTPAACEHWTKNRHITLKALDEDYAMAELIQEGLCGGALPHIVFGRNEPGPAAFHRVLRERLAGSVEQAD